VIHFVHFRGRGFSYLNYLAVLTAAAMNPGVRILLHNDVEPSGNLWWNRARNIARLTVTDPPREHQGVPLEAVQYRADVHRLRLLVERGGIYLDTDVLCLRSLAPLASHAIVMGAEKYEDGWKGGSTGDLAHIASLSNAVLLARPGHPFLVDWLGAMGEGLRSGRWAYHSVRLPLEMLRASPGDVHIEPLESFIPFDFRDPFLFEDMDPESCDRIVEERLSTSYCVHVWETHWHESHLAGLDPDRLRSRSSPFTTLFRRYARC
jgi:hypothetical protein